MILKPSPQDVMEVYLESTIESITQPFYVNFREDSLGRALIPRLIGMLIEDFRSLKGG